MNTSRSISIVFLLFFLLMNSQELYAFQSYGSVEKSIQSVKLSNSEQLDFRFDGQLNESFWQSIPAATGFRQQAPIEGDPATEKTEVRIAYDDKNLYIGVILFDTEPDQIKAFQKRRDQRITADERFVWIFDTFNDQRNAYFMEINPNGMRTDGLVSTGQGGGINLSWDGIWDARTYIGEFGWSAEIKIPFSSLNFDENSSQWGVNFMRVIRRKNETALWTGFRRNQGLARPQNAGVLTGLEDVSQGLGLEVVPFGILSANKEVVETSSSTEISPDAGVDINYSITPSLKASLTFNTDFAEAEVDQRQVNLSRFAIAFPEQRDFFLEGANIYSFAPSSGIDPYFSRRIGLNEGNPIPITFGARLLGNVGKNNLALLQARTRESGTNSAENFTVARVKRNIGTESTIGFIYTRRSEDVLFLGENDFSEGLQTFGSDLELATSSFLGDKNLQFQAFFVFHNANSALNESSDFLDRSSRGLRLNFPNRPWFGHVSYREFGDAFDPAVGFARRVGFRRLQPSIGFAPQFSNSDVIEQVEWGIRFEHLMDLDFTLLTQDLVFTLGEVQFSSGEQISVDVARNYELLEVPFDILRDGTIIIPAGDYANWVTEVGIETAEFRKLSGELEVEYGGYWSGTYTEIEAGMRLRPVPGIELTPSFERSMIRLPEGDFNTNLFLFEGIWDLSTELFLTLNVQYDNLSEEIGLNNRLRWIITPGSDLFLVYNHNWEENPLGRYETINQAGVVKVSYTFRF
ncbi:MAG: carbohydrate binding family 9 domain-containing protein [Balneolaceae bacterium]|nr:carbohydrate binding family 9 domain-containing protein [Balneolaceae bacterium]